MDALKFPGFGRGEKAGRVLQGLVQPARAKIVSPPLQQGKGELHGQDLFEHRQVFFRELLLQIDRVRRDDGLLTLRDGEQNRWDQIRQALADARAGLDGEMPAVLQGARHGHGHLLLLRAIFEILRARQQARRRKNLLDLRHEVRAGGLGFNDGNHFKANKPQPRRAIPRFLARNVSDRAHLSRNYSPVPNY